MNTLQIVSAIRAAIVANPTLAYKRYRGHPMSGFCYIACEAIAHLRPELKPHHMRVGEVTHWYLQGPGGIVDPTWDQFPHMLDYSTGRACGFLTVVPSKRARVLLAHTGMIFSATGSARISR